jgi:hypothetical protein
MISLAHCLQNTLSSLQIVSVTRVIDNELPIGEDTEVIFNNSAVLCMYEVDMIVCTKKLIDLIRA